MPTTMEPNGIVAYQPVLVWGISSSVLVVSGFVKAYYAIKGNAEETVRLRAALNMERSERLQLSHEHYQLRDEVRSNAANVGTEMAVIRTVLQQIDQTLKDISSRLP